jgi:lysozyme
LRAGSRSSRSGPPRRSTPGPVENYSPRDVLQIVMTLRSTLTGALALTCIAILTCSAPALAGKGRTKGIDVSRFQERISWKQVGKTNIRFAYVQASRGDGKDCTVVPEECGRDRYYPRNYSNAKSVGIRVGAYHRAFAKGGSRSKAKEDARAEANRFIAVVGKVRRNDLRPALDVESPFERLDAGRLRLWIRTWINRVEKKLAVEPIIYTNASSWSATGDSASFAAAGYPLWVANFDVDKPLVPAENWAGRGWTIWQYTSSGRVRGIDGKVDRDLLKKGFGKLNPR